MEKITFIAEEDGEAIELYVIEETKINGINYLLVTEDEEDEDAEAYILKDMSESGDEEALCEFVEDEEELEYVSKIFTEILDDIDLER